MSGVLKLGNSTPALPRIHGGTPVPLSSAFTSLVTKNSVLYITIISNYYLYWGCTSEFSGRLKFMCREGKFWAVAVSCLLVRWPSYQGSRISHSLFKSYFILYCCFLLRCLEILLLCFLTFLYFCCCCWSSER